MYIKCTFSIRVPQLWNTVQNTLKMHKVLQHLKQNLKIFLEEIFSLVVILDILSAVLVWTRHIFFFLLIV